MAHDAGAANILLAWLAAAPSLLVQVYVEGPAARLWSARFGNRNAASSLEEALTGARFVLTGSGWGSDLEWRALREARRRGLRTASVLDHWVNYSERFTRSGTLAAPDVFWVTDADAERLARRAFPGAPVQRHPNLYLEAELARIGPCGSAPDVLLYVLEPVRDDWGRGVPGEFQALDYLVDRLPALGLPARTVLRLRPHPSDPPGKFDAWLAGRRCGLEVQLDDRATLAESISGARWVAGCESFALAVALAAGREVIGTLPPWAPPCRLPQAGIRHLRDL